MEWGQVLTIIFGVAGFMSIFVFLINKRIDTLENSLNTRIDSLERRIERLEDDIKELRSEMREIRELLYKALGVETKKS